MAPKFPPIKKQHVVLILSLLLNILTGSGALPSLSDDAPACPPAVTTPVAPGAPGGLEPADAAVPH